ncbi:MAG: S9 family peptidase [Bacteroidetes bacterium]|nr:S9 family peptidase [Bacteroidota bacterium]
MKAILGLFLVLAMVLSITAQKKRPITVDDMWTMKRVSNLAVSPDGKTLAFTVQTYSMEENKGQKDIYLIDADGKNLRPLLNSPENESSPVFSPDGKTIAYSFGGQIWTCDYEGNNSKQLTDVYTGASGFEYSPDGTKALFTSMVWPQAATQEENKALDEAKANDPVEAEVFTELMYRHWDDWRGPKRSHIFLLDLATGEYNDLMLFSKTDCPPLALGGSDDYSFSPDSKEVTFTMNTEKVIATNTNNDIFVIKFEDVQKGKETPYTRISKSGGNDVNPVYSPDGKYIAFLSMERAGFEADKQRFTLYNRATGELNYVSQKIDHSYSQIVWAKDSKSVYLIAANEINESIYKLDIESAEETLVLEKRVNGSLNLCSSGNNLFFLQQRSYMPQEVFMVSVDGGKETQITSMNEELLSQLEMNEVETFWSEGAEGAKVQSLLVKPPFFDENKTYPMIFLIHGGPQGHWDDNFHYRWNTQMFASMGYVVVAPNPRGSVGYGQKFCDEISGDWGGKVYVDLMNAYDHAIANYKFIDAKNTFATGASYGGYMINWIEGHNDKFNALICHDGVFNLTSMYGTTEELWFPEWEYHGAPWESRDIYEKWSPHMFVDNFKTPMMVIHGGMDFRVPEGQAFELFTSLQKMNVDSKFLYFPKETHFVLKPQNARFWWKNTFDWFEQHKVR